MSENRSRPGSWPIMRSLILSLALATGLEAHLALADGKPKLSAEMRAVIEEQGAAAARQRFGEIYPAQADAYEFDLQGMAELGQEYMLAGDMEKGMAVMEMNGQLAQGSLAGMMQSAPDGSAAAVMAQMQEQERPAKAQQAADAEAARAYEQQAQRQAEAQSRGPARDDLDRFTGMYGPEGSRRQLWVMKSCDGYLVSGASWGDASNWWMRSAGDSEFIYQDAWINLRMTFSGGPGGMTLSHDLEQLIDSPLTRSGPVPADWGECLERPLR